MNVEIKPVLPGESSVHTRAPNQLIFPFFIFSLKFAKNDELSHSFTQVTLFQFFGNTKILLISQRCKSVLNKAKTKIRFSYTN